MTRVERGPIWRVYAVMVAALLLAGALRTEGLLAGAQRLPFGPQRDVLVTVARTAHEGAQRAGLDRPASWMSARQDDAVAAMDDWMQAGSGPRGVSGGEVSDLVQRIRQIFAPVVRWTRLAGTGLQGASMTRSPDTDGALAGAPTDEDRPHAAVGGRTTAAGRPTERHRPTVGSDDAAAGDVPDGRPRSDDDGASNRPGGDDPPGSRTPHGFPADPSDGSDGSRKGAVRTSAPQRARPERISRERPLRVHVAGDSMAQPLGYALQREATETGMLEVTLDFQISTGLTRPDFFDWPERISETLTTGPRFDVLVFFVGGNEDQNMVITRNGEREGLVLASPEWGEEYRARATEVMDLVADVPVRLIWVGMPIMREPDHAAAARVANEEVAAAADRRDHVTYVDTWSMFLGADGEYTAWMPNREGHPVDVRDRDGVHLSVQGTERVARRIVSVLQTSWDLSTPTPTATATPSPTATSTAPPSPTPDAARTSTPMPTPRDAPRPTTLPRRDGTPSEVDRIGWWRWEAGEAGTTRKTSAPHPLSAPTFRPRAARRAGGVLDVAISSAVQGTEVKA